MRSDNKSSSINIANAHDKEQNKNNISTDYTLDESTVKTQMRNSVLEGNAFAVMAGFTQAYLAPFAIALNAPLEIVAFVTAIPEFLGSSVKLATIRILKTRSEEHTSELQSHVNL